MNPGLVVWFLNVFELGLKIELKVGLSLNLLGLELELFELRLGLLELDSELKFEMLKRKLISLRSKILILQGIVILVLILIQAFWHKIRLYSSFSFPSFSILPISFPSLLSHRSFEIAWVAGRQIEDKEDSALVLE